MLSADSPLHWTVLCEDRHIAVETSKAINGGSEGLTVTLPRVPSVQTLRDFFNLQPSNRMLLFLFYNILLYSELYVSWPEISIYKSLYIQIRYIYV